MRLNALLRWQFTFENVIKERSWRHRLLTILHSCACATPCTCAAVVHLTYERLDRARDIE
jgi:hypothetical protein